MKKFCLVLALLLAAASLAQALPAQSFKATTQGLSKLHFRPAPVFARAGNLKTVTSVWFTSNGAPTHVSPQGAILTWAANCLTNDTLQWELWIDSNKNGLFDSLGANQDLQLFVYSVANGDTLNNRGLPDTTAVLDNEIVNALKNGFAPTLYWMRAISLVDGSSAFDSVRVTPMVSPWATVSGHVHVPGDSALQQNLWLEADLYTGGNGGGENFWAAITDEYGNYTINMDNAYLDTLWDIGGLSDLAGGYIAPADTTIRVNGGSYTGVNFAYAAATDSVTGDITLFGGGTPTFSIEAYAGQGSGNNQKYTNVINGHYQLFFSPSDSGTWYVGAWFDNAGYMRPNSVNLTPVGAGHLIQDFVLYPANDSIKGRVTESGGAPTRQYQLNAWSNNSQFSNQVVSDAQGYYTLLVSSLATDYSVNVNGGSDEYPIPDGWTVTPSGYYPVDPPATGKNFNLSPATEFIEGQITQDAGDAQPIDLDQTTVGAGPVYGGSWYYSSPNMSGQYSIPAVPDTYNVQAWVNNGGFLFKPGQQSMRVHSNDTIRNIDFLANYGHCRVEVNLAGYPAADTNWMGASDAVSWPNGYYTNTQVTAPGTYNLYICNSTGWTLYAPNAGGYNVTPGSYSIGDITHSDTYRGVYAFTYTTGVEGQPKDRPMPTVFKLSQNSPNPASGRTRIDYQLPQPGRVSLVIYNILGQEIRRYGLGTQQPGYYSVNWDGRDENGRNAVAGVYLYRLQAGSNAAIRKMTVLR